MEIQILADNDVTTLVYRLYQIYHTEMLLLVKAVCIWEKCRNSLFSIQFCCDLKLLLKNIVHS